MSEKTLFENQFNIIINFQGIENIKNIHTSATHANVLKIKHSNFKVYFINIGSVTLMAQI